MRIENNGEYVFLTMNPDEADTVATLLNAALLERLVNMNPDELELWEHVADTVYVAATQAHAINAKNFGG